MTCTQITQHERYAMWALRKRGYPPAAIGREVKRHRSTITRELRRNVWRQNRAGYYPLVAQSYTSERRRVARRGSHFSDEEWAFVEELIREEWSPEQIVGWCARFGIPVMSHETIYRRIAKDRKTGGTLWTHLRVVTKKYRKRYGAYDSRGRLAGKRHISTRPAEVETRMRLGDWEGDTVHGSTQHNACIVTMVERKSSFLAIGQLDRCGATETTARLKQLIEAQPHLVRTLTLDNGTEFHGHKQLEAMVDTVCYFATPHHAASRRITPHHAWERGSNENVSGLIRQTLKKGVSMAHLAQRDCQQIADKLNRWPRKRLGFRTPEEVYAQ